jgi:hypothetical protein
MKLPNRYLDRHMLMLGETHGTREMPALVNEVLEQARARDKDVVLGVELSRDVSPLSRPLLPFISADPTALSQWGDPGPSPGLTLAAARCQHLAKRKQLMDQEKPHRPVRVGHSPAKIRYRQVARHLARPGIARIRFRQ